LFKELVLVNVWIQLNYVHTKFKSGIQLKVSVLVHVSYWCTQWTVMLTCLYVGMMSAAASLGLVLLWDIDAGLTQLDKYLYSKEDYIKVV